MVQYSAPFIWIGRVKTCVQTVLKSSSILHTLNIATVAVYNNQYIVIIIYTRRIINVLYFSLTLFKLVCANNTSKTYPCRT